LIEIGNTEGADEAFAKTVKGLTQKFALVPEVVKQSYLNHVLEQVKVKKNQQIIVFTSTCRNCHFLAMLLTELGFDVTMLHSQLSMRKRMVNLIKFKSQHVNILIATDVASRGLDIPKVTFVLNYDVPRAPKDYVHRVGRTARAGRGGTALTFVTQYDVELLMSIEEYIGCKVEKSDEIDDKKATDDVTHIAKVMNVVRIKMSEQGITDKFDDFESEKRRVKKEKDKSNKVKNDAARAEAGE